MHREIDPQVALDAQLMRIAVSVHGHHKRIAAIVSIQERQDSASLGQAQATLSELIGKLHDPLSWQVDVAGQARSDAAGQGQMSDNAVSLPRLPAIALGDVAARVTLKFRPGHADDRVSDSKLEALGPVLPELVSELMTMMALDSERE